MHTRDYSEHTSQVIDDEVELILRAQEQRALEVLARHRGGLDAVARALLDDETIDGETVGRLVDTAYGRAVHAPGAKTVPPIFVASQHGPTGSDNVDGPPDGVAAASADLPPAAVPSAAAGDGAAPTGDPAGSVPSTTSNAADAAHDVATAPGEQTAPGGSPGNGSQPQAGHWPPPNPWPTKQSPWPPPPPPTSR